MNSSSRACSQNNVAQATNPVRLSMQCKARVVERVKKSNLSSDPFLQLLGAFRLTLRPPFVSDLPPVGHVKKEPSCQKQPRELCMLRFRLRQVFLNLCSRFLPLPGQTETAQSKRQ